MVTRNLFYALTDANVELCIPVQSEASNIFFILISRKFSITAEGLEGYRALSRLLLLISRIIAIESVKSSRLYLNTQRPRPG